MRDDYFEILYNFDIFLFCKSNTIILLLHIGKWCIFLVNIICMRIFSVFMCVYIYIIIN